MLTNKAATSFNSATLLWFDLLYCVDAAIDSFQDGQRDDQSYVKVALLSISIIDKISVLTNLIANFDPSDSCIKILALRVR